MFQNVINHKAKATSCTNLNQCWRTRDITRNRTFNRWANIPENVYFQEACTMGLKFFLVECIGDRVWSFWRRNSQKYSGLYVVLSLIGTLPKHQNCKTFFGFSLKDNGYLATAALSAVCTKFCTLLAGKDLKKQGRRSHCFRTDANSAISVT